MVKLSRSDADVFVPDSVEIGAALSRTTHLCIGAHQDDQEFMAYHGIAECFGKSDSWFGGVIVTNGAGSARAGLYADYSDDDMKEIRRHEQRKASVIGEYSVQLQLNHPSSAIKDPSGDEVVSDLTEILLATRPDAVYTHNPADKHDTHVAVALRTIAALRAMPEDARPSRVLGCEIWRSLDWLCDEDKQVLPVDTHPNLAAALSGIFDSQIVGGKRYDAAVMGRRMANATFFESHQVDTYDALSWGMDLTELIRNPELDIVEFTLDYIERFKTDVTDRVGKLLK
jgi:LmbE family N-acetylglucosaminyl deacetylase